LKFVIIHVTRQESLTLGQRHRQIEELKWFSMKHRIRHTLEYSWALFISCPLKANNILMFYFFLNFESSVLKHKVGGNI